LTTPFVCFLCGVAKPNQVQKGREIGRAKLSTLQTALGGENTHALEALEVHRAGST
jgi:hypothetical protein